MQMEKRKKCQGGCAGQVLDILPAVQAAEERNWFSENPGIVPAWTAVAGKLGCKEPLQR